MKHKIEFISNKSKNILKKETLNYFQNQGYKLITQNENSIQLEQGSLFQNMITFNPLKWKSRIEVQFEKENIKAIFDINTTYQIVTLKEERLWEKFISNYQKTINTGKSFISENEIELKKTKKSVWIYMGHGILGAIVFGVPSGIIAYLTENVIFIIIGSVSGAMIFMTRKVNNDRKDNAT